jgi:endonuclease/exonuclease/phosphatase (EEP) superfamily protein YafD
VVITAVVVAYAIGMLAFAVAVAIVGDRNAIGMLLLFGPRWLLVFPWLLLVPLAWLRSRAVLFTAVAGAMVTLFGVSGFEVPSPRAIWNTGAAGKALRIVSYNTDRSEALASRIAVDMVSWNADVIVMQDCAADVAAAMRAATEAVPYEVFRDSEFCVATRLPVLGPAVLSGSRAEGRAVTLVVEWQGTPIMVGTVHLPSPRNALWAARQGSAELLDGSVQQRAAASGALAGWFAEAARGPLIVAGDFNLPVESHALRRDWSWLRNAFSEAGWGFGHTMFAGRHRVRIDHVLVSAAFRVRGARVLSGYPSEHQPVVAEVESARHVTHTAQ